MKEDPIISGGVVKAAIVVLVAGLIGVGAYAIAGGDGIDLPDLPDLETLGDESTTTLESTSISETTIGGEDTEVAASDPFTSAGFEAALKDVRDAAGPGRKLTRLFINDVQTQFILLAGDDGAEAYSVRVDTGELVQEEATITISGTATLDDFAFALDGIDAGAVDRMLDTAKSQSGAADFKPTVVSLERSIPTGSRKLEWTINAQGGGRNLLFRADADGSNVRDEGGGGTPIPAGVSQAQKLNECIEAAGENPDEIFACLGKFQ